MTPSSALSGTFSPRGEGKINYLNGTAVLPHIIPVSNTRHSEYNQSFRSSWTLLFMLSLLLIFFSLLSAYLIGSICSAVIISQLFHLPDPRMEGSKNPGTTNVLRLAGKKYAIIVLLTDVLKGTLPVVLAAMCGAGTTLLGFTCLAAVLGHVYPVFFDFNGGKGVATALGALLGFHPLLGLGVTITWLLVASISRYASLASITALGLAPFYACFAADSRAAFVPLFIMAGLVLYQHRANFSRLLNHTEPQINLSARLNKKEHP